MFSLPVHAARIGICPLGVIHGSFIAKPSSYNVHSRFWCSQDSKVIWVVKDMLHPSLAMHHSKPNAMTLKILGTARAGAVVCRGKHSHGSTMDEQACQWHHFARASMPAAALCRASMPMVALCERKQCYIGIDILTPALFRGKHAQGTITQEKVGPQEHSTRASHALCKGKHGNHGWWGLVLVHSL